MPAPVPEGRFHSGWRVAALGIALTGLAPARADPGPERPTYEPTWRSLDRRPVARW